MVDYTRDAKRYVALGGLNFDRNQIRDYLASLTVNSRRKVLAALKQLYRFLECPEIVAGFKLPKTNSRIIRLPSKAELQRFYQALPDLMHKAVFLMLASSGLRLGELLSLTFDDIDFNLRMLIPKCHKGSTKHSYLSFYNLEAEKALKEYLEAYRIKEGRMFPVAKRTIENGWAKISRQISIKVYPQRLREWFCSEMGRLGIGDRYIDAYQGRVPKSVLARHYTDFSPERLKEIYDKAGLKVQKASDCILPPYHGG